MIVVRFWRMVVTMVVVVVVTMVVVVVEVTAVVDGSQRRARKHPLSVVS